MGPIFKVGSAKTLPENPQVADERFLDGRGSATLSVSGCLPTLGRTSLSSQMISYLIAAMPFTYTVNPFGMMFSVVPVRLVTYASAVRVHLLVSSTWTVTDPPELALLMVPLRVEPLVREKPRVEILSTIVLPTIS